jgi:hypothetical protein
LFSEQGKPAPEQGILNQKSKPTGSTENWAHRADSNHNYSPQRIIQVTKLAGQYLLVAAAPPHTIPRCNAALVVGLIINFDEVRNDSPESCLTTLPRIRFLRPSICISGESDAMAYESRWERLRHALERVMAATEETENEAKADICRAIADGAIGLRGKLKEDSTKLHTSNAVVEGGELRIPHDLIPEHLDWENSRPLKLWNVAAEQLRVRKLWYLDWIELSVANVTQHLCRPGRQDEAAQDALSDAGAASRSRPARERVLLAIAELYPQGVPTQANEPNASLFRRVGRWLRERQLPNASDETILRAAGRRR